MYKAIKRIVQNTSDGLSFSNEQALTRNGPSVFVANHRDILLDSAILQMLLVDLGLETSEITFGSNLMINDFIIDFGKTNRMYTVFRSGSAREMHENSKRLSNYVHYTITEKKQSSWIAQRKGRTKNGWDQTDPTVLKMLTTFNRKNPFDAFLELNIVPVIISYEYEPCDLLKIRELYLSKEAQYVKQEGEDFQSVLHGITNPKGKIHLAIGDPVGPYLKQHKKEFHNNNIHQKVAEFIDSEIAHHYQLYPNNYWAYDRLHQSTGLAEKYDAQTQEIMLERLEQLYELMGTKNDELQRMFLELYANPYIQKQSLL
jgi:hypothetical protein